MGQLLLRGPRQFANVFKVSSVEDSGWVLLRFLLAEAATFRFWHQAGSTDQIPKRHVPCRSFFGADNHRSPPSQVFSEHSHLVDFDEI